jgi:FkbM family methyltransferase
MVNRIRKILTRFSGCYNTNRRFFDSVRFSLKLGKDGYTRIRITQNQEIYLRKNESDQEVFLTTFVDQFHRSPIHLGKSPVIVDLGCNIGLTIIDFKLNYPDARVIGVEMDKANFDLCKQNIQGLAHCEVVNAAIWKQEGVINYTGENEQSYAVSENSTTFNDSAKCITMQSLIVTYNLGQIDYIKMDIEGAEKSIILDAESIEWLENVKYLSIELHDLPDINNTGLAKSLTAVLEKRNFLVYKDAKHWSSIFAINTMLHK